MKVDVFCDERKAAELYVVQREKALRYGLFTFDNNGEDEYYFDRVEDGVLRLTALFGT